MPSPYTPHKISTATWFFLSLLAMAIGVMMSKTPAFPLGILLAILGCVHAARHFARLLRIVAAEHILFDDSAEELDQRSRQGTLPQQIFLLLFTVAETDGSADRQKRDLVRRFLFEQFRDARVHAELMAWDAVPVPQGQIGSLVHEIRLQLSGPECVTLFYWCCVVALVDRRFSEQEHSVLQKVARHLGLAATHARQVFLHAKLKILEGAGQRAGGPRTWSQRPGGGRPRPRATHTDHRRARALQILGLDESATREDVRRRHRELVKKHHPDAHTHLGPVAQQQATERFLEIQEAYEALTRSA